MLGYEAEYFKGFQPPTLILAPGSNYNPGKKEKSGA
jgi:hypothetical protein